MVATPEKQYMTPEEYLEWEAQQEMRHEYLNGEVYAMTGGTLAHNTIAINLTALLKNPVRRRGCQIFMADVKVQISALGTPYFYPDVVVTCRPEDRQSKQIIQSPCLIVEVLSPNTESCDRGEKFAQYRRLESLQEYVLIDSTKVNVEIFRLNERQKWELTPYAPGEIIQFSSIEFECPIDLLYEDVEVPSSKGNVAIGAEKS